MPQSGFDILEVIAKGASAYYLSIEMVKYKRELLTIPLASKHPNSQIPKKIEIQSSSTTPKICNHKT